MESLGEVGSDSMTVEGRNWGLWRREPRHRDLRVESLPRMTSTCAVNDSPVLL